MSDADAIEPSETGGRQWLDKANEDLVVAELILTSTIAARWAAGFHAQQAAEKAVKALLVTSGIDFPRTHSLERLADLLGDAAGIFDRSALIDLTPWAVAGRYPEDMPDPSAEEASELVASARTVVEAAHDQLLEG